MDAFDQASENVSGWLERLCSSDVSPEPADHADVFLHSLDQFAIEVSSALRGSRFSAPITSAHSTVVEGVAVRTLSDRIERFSATSDLSQTGVTAMLDNLGSDEAVLGGKSDGPYEPDIRRDRTDASTRPDLSLVARGIHDALLSGPRTVKSVKVRVGEIQTKRSIAVGRPESDADQLGNTPTGPMTDESKRVEIVTAVGLPGRTVSALRTRPISDVESVGFIDRLARDVVSGMMDERCRIGLPDRPGRDRSEARVQVILPAGWGGVWMHEAIGHQVEADSILSGRSVLTGKLNHMVGPGMLTVRDSALVPNGRIVQAFDDEGVQSTDTVVIDRGRFVRVLSDRRSSLRHGYALTGSGRRAHYAQPPTPRMTNLVLEPGEEDAESLIGSVQSGILVEEIAHAWFNPVDGHVCLQVSESRLIDRGRPTEWLEPLLLCATPQEILSGLVAVANDFQTDRDRGYCVKGGSAIPVGVGQPSVLIDGMAATA